MDGFGLNPLPYGNAIAAAGTPYVKSLVEKYPHASLGASGLDVGLPEGQMGNSEVGHLNIGAGRIVYQDFTRISKAIKDGDFFENKAFLKAIANAKDNGKKLHIMGLTGPGGVHSHIEHLFALLKLAKMQDLSNVFVHCFMDGRDLPPTSGKGYIAEIEEYMKELGVGKIATVTGRYYAMDRDNRWDRVEKAYDMLTVGAGEKYSSAIEAMEANYARGVTDEFITPAVICEKGEPRAVIAEGDSVIFYNFRPDRAREITRAFISPEFDRFERKTGYLKPVYVGLTRYDDSFQNISTAFAPQSLKNTLGEYFASNSIRQLRIAETEKYAHVTFFFNGGVEPPYAGEDRILVPSSKVATFDLLPEMSAPEVTQKALEAIRSEQYDVMILNFANCDMVGHTGVMEAAVAAVKEVDKDVGILVDEILRHGGTAFVTADHGNADQMIDYVTGEPFTAHTTYPVPFIACGEQFVGGSLRAGGKLCDIAPTMLKSMKLDIPSQMTGEPLF